MNFESFKLYKVLGSVVFQIYRSFSLPPILLWEKDGLWTMSSLFNGEWASSLYGLKMSV